jgi:valyl-tRNA synthetase
MTEEAWRYIPHKGEALILADWPTANTQLIDDEIEAEMNTYLDLVKGVRNTRTEYNVDPGKRISAIASSETDNLGKYSYIFQRLCNIEQITLMTSVDNEPENAASIVGSGITLYLPLEGMLDIEAECKRLKAEKEKITQALAKTERMLGNENFVKKARPDVVQKERDRLAELQASQAQIDDRLTNLCS